MSTENQKEYLHQEVDQGKQETSLENIYDQLAMLSDIDDLKRREEMF